MNRCENGNLSVLLYSLVISFTVLEERLYMVLLKLTNVYLPLLCCFYVFSINDLKKKISFHRERFRENAQNSLGSCTFVVYWVLCQVLLALWSDLSSEATSIDSHSREN